MIREIIFQWLPFFKSQFEIKEYKRHEEEEERRRQEEAARLKPQQSLSPDEPPFDR